MIVNDARGFFTSRVFGTYCQEGIAMLTEGVAAAAIENGALLAGFPVGPLAVSDEVSLTLMSRIRHQTIADLRAEGRAYQPHRAESVIDWMLEQQRAGKAAGRGFYEYPDGGRKFLWPGLATRFQPAVDAVPLADIRERLLFVESLETVRCLDEGVVTTVARREHRLDLRHRLPGLDRRRAAVRERLRARALRGARPRAGRTLRRSLRAAGLADRARRAQRTVLSQRRRGDAVP